jgi:hypothetical protein
VDEHRSRQRVVKEFYEHRILAEWYSALAPLGTDFVKAHLTDAP